MNADLSLEENTYLIYLYVTITYIYINIMIQWNRIQGDYKKIKETQNELIVNKWIKTVLPFSFFCVTYSTVCLYCIVLYLYLVW